MWRVIGRLSLLGVLLAGACSSSASPPDGGVKDGAPDAGGLDANADRSVADIPVEDARQADGALDGPLDTSALDAPAPVVADTATDTAAPLDAAPDTTAADAPASDGPLPYHWTSLHAPLGSAVSALALGDDGTLYAGADCLGPCSGDSTAERSRASGVWLSRDGGRAWAPVGVALTDYRVQALALSGSRLLVGSSELIRTLDGGRTSEVVLRTSIDTFGGLALDGTLAIAASTSYAGPPWRSDDGGATWTLIAGPPSGADNHVVILDDVVLVANGDGLWRSTDRGATFHRVPGVSTQTSFQRARVACDGVTTCLASAWAPEGLIPTLFRSTDAGLTWTALAVSGNSILTMSDSGSVFAATAGAGLPLARSDDLGATWIPLGGPGVGVRTLVARRQLVYAGTDNGVFRSEDNGATWAAASGSRESGPLTGPAAPVLVDTSASSAAGDLYLPVGFSSPERTSLRSQDDGRTWSALPRSASVCAITGAGTLLCDAGFNAGLVRSTDHGATWSPVPSSHVATVASLVARGSEVYAGTNTGSSDSVWLAGSSDDGLTFHDLTAPTGERVQLLADGTVLVQSAITTLRSTDHGASWTPFSQTLLPVAEGAGGRLYAQSRGEVSYSDDRGSTWMHLAFVGTGDSGPLVIDGRGRFFAPMVGAYPDGPASIRGSALWTSDDGGTTWRLAPAQLPHPYVSSFALDKLGRLLASTNGGVYRLDDGP
jgi:hypothetical protein